MGLRLDRNSGLISALSGLHHCHSQKGVHTDSWEICSDVQLYIDECKNSKRSVLAYTMKRQTDIVKVVPFKIVGRD